MNVIQFNNQQFNRLFPFYFVLDKDLRLVSLGNSLVKLINISIGDEFERKFRIQRPVLEALNFQSILSLQHQLVALDYLLDTSISLRGQFEYLEETQQLLFIGSPWLSTIEEIKKYHLNLNDFAPHDPIIDLLHLLKNQEVVTEEVKILLNTISHQKSDLKRLSLIAEETLNGVVITDAKGRVDWINSGFEKMTGYSLAEIKNKTPGSVLQGDESSVETIYYLKQQIQQQEPFVCEIINYNKFGKKYWVRINGQPLFSNNKELTGFFAIEEDITQEKEAELKLQSYEERFRIALEKIGDNVWIHDFELNITEFSKNDTAFLGYDLSEPFQNAQTWWNCVHPDDKWILEENDKNYRSGKIDHHNLEYRIIHQSGAIKWVLDRGIVFEHHNNIPLKIIGTHTDITKLKESENALTVQKKFYETILNNIPADIAVFDKEHHYLFVNPKGIKNTEVRNWIIGKKDEDYIKLRNKPKYILEGRRKLFNEVMKTKKLKSWEEEILKPDGSKEYVLRNMYPHFNDKDELELIIGYGVDITERKIIEQQIKLSETRYKNLINNSLALITTHNLEGIFTMVNPMVCKVFGYPENEIVGHSLADFIPPQDVPSLESSYLKVIKEKKQANGVFRLISKKGNIIYNLYNNYLMEEEGKEPYVISYSVDITDRIKIEKELKIAQRETEEAAIAKERFLANMSHEIRTPMNGILGITGFLAKTDLSPKQREYIHLIRESTSNLLVILNDVLDLEKIIAGKLELEKTPFNITEKIKLSTESFRYKSEEKELFLEYDNRLPEHLFVEGDPHRLSQILLNLVGNAVKFTEKGSIVIGAKISWETATEVEIEFSVTDSGIGIAKDKLKQIFDPYVQAKSDISRKYGGTGLGLSICKHLVEIQKGKIEVTSKEAQGSIFKFTIPYQKSKQQVVKTITQYNYESMKDKKILVAEDVEVNQYVMKSTLEAWGCTTTIVDNGKKAVEAVKNNDFDLILMDVQMPEMNGFEATEVIRSLPDKRKATLPIIAVTANSLKGINERYISSGMNDYILKPFEESKLFLVMERYLIVKNNQPKTTDSTSFYDSTQLTKMSGGDKTFIKKLAEIFIRTSPLTFDLMIEALQTKNWQEVSREAHKLKSSIDSMGITSGKDIIRKIEERCKAEKDLDTIEALCSDFKIILQASIEQLKNDFVN
jgi:PAS domain S-box-containing protein